MFVCCFFSPTSCDALVGRLEFAVDVAIDHAEWEVG